MSFENGLIPSSFLPHLPRAQNTLQPLSPSELLAHISILRELYLPPIHGGFHADDSFDDDDEDRQTSSKFKKKKSRNAGPIAGLAAGMNGLGLGFGMVSDFATEESATPIGGRSGTATPHVESGSTSSIDDQSDDDEDEEVDTPHLDPFEREWAEKWLGGVVRRSQTWLEETLESDQHDTEHIKEVEAVLRDATAVLAMMAGTSAAGSLTRHLVFPIADSLAPALSLLRSNAEPNPALSPETNTFLASLAASPTSPKVLRRSSVTVPTSTYRRQSIRSDLSTSTTCTSLSPTRKQRKRKRSVIPVLLHDAPMGDHLGVGMQTWGSAILLGRRMALRPEDFGLFLHPQLAKKRGVRVLELGAGTGLLSILCRKLLDLQNVSDEEAGAGNANRGLVVATDFLPNVLDNLKICVDLNFPPHLEDSGKVESSTDIARNEGIHIAKLDWTTFPSYMSSNETEGQEELAPFVSQGEGKEDRTFDLVLASDCVYDETHAKLLRDVAGWVLRLPEPSDPDDQGGTFHILSPLRPTFAPELESIDTLFPPLSTYVPLKQRQAAASPESEATKIAPESQGEGLGIARRLKLGTRGQGKRSVSGRKGEGRVDENGGYWWWEVGWG